MKRCKNCGVLFDAFVCPVCGQLGGEKIMTEKKEEKKEKEVKDTTKKKEKFDYRKINELKQVIPAINAIIEYLKKG